MRGQWAVPLPTSRLLTRAKAALGEIGIWVWCEYEVRRPFDGLPPNAYVPDIVLRCGCTACGSRSVHTALDWTRS